MTSSTSHLRRLRLFAAGALATAAGVVALAPAAQAADDRLTLKPVAVCIDRSTSWLPTVEVTNNTDQTGKFNGGRFTPLDGQPIGPHETVTFPDRPISTAGPVEVSIAVWWPDLQQTVLYKASVRNPAGCHPDLAKIPPNNCQDKPSGTVQDSDSRRAVIRQIELFCPGLSLTDGVGVYTRAEDRSWHLYDFRTATIDNAHPRAEIPINWAACESAYDFSFSGNDLPEILPEYMLQTRTKHLVGRSCTDVPKLKTTTACDGTLTVDLTQSTQAADEYTVTSAADASFTRTVPLAAGAGTTLTIPAKAAGSVHIKGKRQIQGAPYEWDLQAAPAPQCAPALTSTIAFTAQCTTMTIAVRNTGTAPVNAQIQLSGSTYPDDLITVQPGKTATIVADTTKAAAATVQSVDTVKSYVYKKPATCGTTPPSSTPPTAGATPTSNAGGSAGGGSGLPITGAPTMSLVAGAAALVALGAALLLLGRRRRRF
jgi:hypothetical protein